MHHVHAKHLITKPRVHVFSAIWLVPYFWLVSLLKIIVYIALGKQIYITVAKNLIPFPTLSYMMLVRLSPPLQMFWPAPLCIRGLGCAAPFNPPAYNALSYSK